MRAAPTSATSLSRVGVVALLLAVACGGAGDASEASLGADEAGAGAEAAPSTPAAVDGGAFWDGALRRPDSGNHFGSPVPEAGVADCSSPLDVDVTFATLDRSPYCTAPLDLVKTGACDGLVRVYTTGAACTTYWIFDYGTGELKEHGEDCANAVSCSALPGFDVPPACVDSLAWRMKWDLCADAGAGGG